MQKISTENTIHAQQKEPLTLQTVWPQMAAGVVFASTVTVAIQHPGPLATIFVAGSGFLFIFTLLYLYSLQKGRRTATSLLTWAGGIALALFSALAAPNFLALSTLFVFAAVCYGLGASSRRAMLIGAVISWLALVACVALHLLVMAGALSVGVPNPPLLMQAGMCVVSLLLAADIMQRLWRHYNRIENAFHDLRIANDELRTARTNLERHVHEQAELLEVSRVIRSTQDLDSLLDEILVQLKRVVDYGTASALILRGGELVAVRRAGLEMKNEALLITALLETPQWQQMVNQKQPIVLKDIFGQTDFLNPFYDYLGTETKSMAEDQHSWMGLPMVVRGEIVGALSMTHHQAGFFTPAQVELAFAFANHAAVAIESSRVREEAVNAAALAERTRLARELHDSVSQALYGMVLSTRTSLELIERDPGMARDTMRYTLELADAALSEMRALIFELRPESLKEDGLLIAFRKQAAALTARHKIDLELHLCEEEPALPINVKDALYRIAMEAIQNTLRHAGAHRLRLTLSCGEYISLTIEDDGCGFNAKREYPGHFGLQSMRERADAIGSRVTISSQPRVGTRVQIDVPTLSVAAHTCVSAVSAMA